jgi:hypothetical protein
VRIIKKNILYTNIKKNTRYALQTGSNQLE